MGLLATSASDVRRALRGNVALLGAVSFFTDLSSEMIYPLLPVFFSGLVSPGAAAVYVGLMDGIAESTSSLLKIVAGRWSDALGRRKPLAVTGYGVSALARPAMALAAAGWHVVGLRFLDRVGKGIRTAPRDALLSEYVDSDVRSLAFSFHRLMDHAGAVGGPVLAALVLYALLGHGALWHQGNGSPSAEEMYALRWLFGAALVPGLITLVLWRWVREAPSRSARSAAQITTGDAPLPREFYVFLGAVTLFTLGNSSDLFLVFYAQTRFGLGVGWVMALWVLLHLAKIAFSLPGGHFSDRVGRRTAIVLGWGLYAAVYAAMPFASNLWMLCGLLTVYGAYYGMTEGAERALVADMAPASGRGRAYGLYHGAVGLAALPASFLFGVFWAALGPHTAFFIGASLALGALLALLIQRRVANRQAQH